MTNGEPYTIPGEPGRLDVNGVEWFACDPYPTWFRWDENDVLHTNPARWADLPPVDPTMDHPRSAYRKAEDCYGHDSHDPQCDQIIKTRWSGVSCDCHARWYCA